MTESPRRPRIAVVWAPEARADLRAIDRPTALEQGSADLILRSAAFCYDGGKSREP